MKFLKSAIFSITVLSLQTSQGGEMDRFEKHRDCPGGQPSENATDKPAAIYKDREWMTVREWCRRFQQNLQHDDRTTSRVLFFGDSITEGWRDQAHDVWLEFFADLDPLQLGIGGDQTQQLLWRIENGELDGTKAEIVVLLIGVNNLGFGGWNEADTVLGIEKVALTITKRLKGVEVLLLKILPAMADPNDPFRKKIQQANHLISNINLKRVTVAGVGEAITDENGRITLETTYDYLHPNRQGYLNLAGKIREQILILKSKRQ